MEITAIKSQKKNAERLNIFIDGGFGFGISAEGAFRSKLTTNQKITEREIQILVQTDQVERLLYQAARFLSYRPRSEKELRDFLLKKIRLKGLTSEVEKANYENSVRKTIDKLKKLKQINDRQFARWWVEQRNKFRPRGLNILKAELVQKGVDKEAIEEILGGQDEEPLAFEVAKKKTKIYQGLPVEEFRIKLGNFLVRRGFSWGLVKKVVDTLSGKEYNS